MPYIKEPLGPALICLMLYLLMIVLSMATLLMSVSQLPPVIFLILFPICINFLKWGFRSSGMNLLELICSDDIIF